MITTPTTLILGAGASYPYGFPLGKKLVDDILDLFPRMEYVENVDTFRFPKTDFIRKLKHLEFEDVFMYEFSNNLRNSKVDSIDSFLENKENSEFLEIGKISILQAISSYENSQELFNTDDWYRILWNALYANTKSKEGFRLNKVSIITYNYDRSLEYYLLNCIKHSYNLSDKDACILLFNTIKIIHVHGKMGYFQIQDKELNLNMGFYNILNYGEDITDYNKLKTLSKNIKIIHDENINESDEIKEANRILANTIRICFLGFGYAEDNIKRLKISNQYGTTEICGSAFDMSDKEIAVKTTNFIFLNPYAHINLYNKNAKCNEFLKNHFIL